MIHKTTKPVLDLVFARFAIFGVLAILFVASSVNGHPSWLTWVVMLWGVFSIFEAAIKADEALENVIDSQNVIEDLTKRVIIQHRIIKYQDQKINQLIEMRGKEIKNLKASHHGEMIGHEVHLKQVKKNRDELRVRVDSLEQALNKVSGWNAHPEGYEANFGAWGVRDFYRSLAKQALAKKE
ncbi:hypothetical protein [Acinetobacter pittii]|uniref:hypothetical protein n=1 Tax=Acinetobacter pittii TaxID=48296 RepID=UPI000837B4CA|nr:hypothetical protein [Acinetobacter pittii]OCY88174.1 hypothetical protein BFR67_16655 [Acinetobacter pittii]